MKNEPNLNSDDPTQDDNAHRSAGGSPTDDRSPEAEHQHHHYMGNDIPWYVRLMWLGFWVFAIVYTIRFVFPAIRIELFQ